MLAFFQRLWGGVKDFFGGLFSAFARGASKGVQSTAEPRRNGTSLLGRAWDWVKEHILNSIPGVFVAVVVVDAIALAFTVVLAEAVLTGIATVLSVFFLLASLNPETRVRVCDFLARQGFWFDLAVTMTLVYIGFQISVTMGLASVFMGFNLSACLSALRWAYAHSWFGLNSQEVDTVQEAPEAVTA